MRTAAMLGVGPEGFWRLSLMEWRMLMERPDGVVPLGRGQLEAMSRQWPDQIISSPSPEVGRDREAQPNAGGDV